MEKRVYQEFIDGDALSCVLNPFEAIDKIRKCIEISIVSVQRIKK